ncbi:MAG: universal stress protein [Catenulispora sp.]|nr:universal stress protein [Catenulispora sp.]
MTGPVVVGIDDFEHSDQLITTAAQEARLRGTALWLAHAYHGFIPVTQGIPPDLTPETVLREAAEEQLAKAAAQVGAQYPDLHLETAAVSGPAAPALAEVADLASLLVVGGRGRGGLTGQLLGSVSLGVLGLAHCPVLVVRAAPKHPEQRVMVGVDVGDPATGPEVLAFAFEEAARRNGGLYAFYAWEDPSVLYAYGTHSFAVSHRREALKAARKDLEGILEPWKAKHPQVPVSYEALAGLPAKLLVESTELVSLVVIGGKARGNRDGMRIGSIAHTVLHHAHCPVAIVPER